MVEWKKLIDVAVIKNGRDYKKLSHGTIPVYGTGGVMTYVDQFASDKPSVLLPRKGSVENIFYVDEPFWTVDTLYWTEIDTSKIYPKFLFISLQRYNLKEFAYGGARPSLSQQILYNLDIPLPSLSEQERIVGILDTFTSSIDNLKQQIAQRRKQYEYYRDQLLDLEGKEGVEMKTLGEFGDVTKLAGFEFTEHVIYKEEGQIIALRGLNVRNGNLDLSQVKYIDGSNFEKLGRSKLLINDMLFTYVGTIGNVALINEDDKYYLAPNVSRIRFDCNVIVPRFALYVFMSEYFHRTQINKFLNSSSMKNLSMENIRKFKLPVPPLSEQQRIVDILDKFEASIQNLESQLSQREKQYEYYRNKLLTFED